MTFHEIADATLNKYSSAVAGNQVSRRCRRTADAGSGNVEPEITIDTLGVCARTCSGRVGAEKTAFDDHIAGLEQNSGAQSMVDGESADGAASATALDNEPVSVITEDRTADFN